MKALKKLQHKIEDLLLLDTKRRSIELLDRTIEEGNERMRQHYYKMFTVSGYMTKAECDELVAKQAAEYRAKKLALIERGEPYP